MTDTLRQGLRDFQASAKGILTPADYFLAGVAHAQPHVEVQQRRRENRLMDVCEGELGCSPSRETAARILAYVDGVTTPSENKA